MPRIHNLVGMFTAGKNRIILVLLGFLFLNFIATVCALAQNTSPVKPESLSRSSDRLEMFRICSMIKPITSRRTVELMTNDRFGKNCQR
jgi:hypothetical protein